MERVSPTGGDWIMRSRSLRRRSEPTMGGGSREGDMYPDAPRGLLGHEGGQIRIQPLRGLSVSLGIDVRVEIRSDRNRRVAHVLGDGLQVRARAMHQGSVSMPKTVEREIESPLSRHRGEPWKWIAYQREHHLHGRTRGPDPASLVRISVCACSEQPAVS